MFLLPLLLVLLLMSIEQFQSLICHSNQTLSFSNQDFNRKNLTDFFNHSASTSSSACHLRLTMNFSKNLSDYARVQFSPRNTSNETRIEFGTTLKFTRLQDLHSVVSYMDYQCSSGDRCEKTFLLKRALPLFRSFDHPLHNNLIALWKNSSSTPYVCDAKIRRDKCASYICFFLYDELKQLTSSKSSCSSSTSIHMYVRTIYMHSARSDIEHEYRCTKNDCTGQIVFDSLPSSTLFGQNNLLRTTRIDQQLNRLILKHAIIITSTLLIIAIIACYIQCRTHRQGYRLTRNV